MIDGLKIQMTTEELFRRLGERVRWHQQAAKEFEGELRKPERERQDRITPENMLEHEMRDNARSS